MTRRLWWPYGQMKPIGHGLSELPRQKRKSYFPTPDHVAPWNTLATFSLQDEEFRNYHPIKAEQRSNSFKFRRCASDSESLLTLPSVAPACLPAWLPMKHHRGVS